MITLNVEKYCHNCSEFEAQVDKLYTDRQVVTYVYCEHKNLCKRIHDYLLKNLKEQENVKEENQKTE